jgi:hypothetical protein
MRKIILLINLITAGRVPDHIEGKGFILEKKIF